MPTSLLDELTAFFEEDAWRFDHMDDPPGIHATFFGDTSQWQCYALAREDTAQCAFYSVLPVTVPANKFAAAAEFITRANFGMMIGNFEMSYADGVVRYKTSIDVKGDKLTFALIRQMVHANCGTMDQYLPGLMSIIYTDISPADAIAKVESSRPQKR
jgi:hypothetical protein